MHKKAFGDHSALEPGPTGKLKLYSFRQNFDDRMIYVRIGFADRCSRLYIIYADG